MSITYNWTFNPLESYPTASGVTDVVFKVHWQLTANTGSQTGSQMPYAVSGYNASIMGAQIIPLPQSGSTFIPFNELTKDIVYGWVTSSMESDISGSVENKYTYLSQSIYNQIYPSVLVQQAPWLSGSI